MNDFEIGKRTERERGLLGVLAFLLLLSIGKPGYSWVNPGFETGDLSGWTVTTNTPLGSLALPLATVVPSGPATNTNGTICAAPTTCLDNIYSGNYAAQLFSSAGDTGHTDWARIEQTDTVPASNPYLSFWFAAVLCGVHFNQAQPYGEDTYVLVEVLQGATLLYSQRFSWYDNAALLVDDGSLDPNGPWKHLPWTQYYYDLSLYVGQQVTIRYTAYDCNQAGHYCWGNIDNAEWLSASQLPTDTPTGTVTPQPTWTRTSSSTPTVTPTFTQTFTWTLTPTVTNTPTRTSTFTSTNTFSLTPTRTATNTLTATSTRTSTVTRTFTRTQTPTFTRTMTATPTVTLTPCGYPGNTCTPTVTPSDIFYVHKNFYNPSTDGPVSIYVEYSRYPGEYSLKIFNTAGEQVRSLIDGTITGPVGDSYFWDGRNEKGEPCASGVYLLYLIEPFDRKAKKLILIR